MITVILYGHLAKQFGKRHRLAVSTPAEAVRAMCANYKAFRQSIMLHGQPGYRVLAGIEDRADETGLHLPVGRARVIKIIPVVAGAGGFGKILLGAALIAAAYSGFLPASPLIEGFTFSVSSIATNIGISLVLSGVSSILFSPPSAPSPAERPENKPSYNFAGIVNTTGQGNAVPICYGRMRIGSQVISASTEAVNL